jgi:hypothetical protein
MKNKPISSRRTFLKNGAILAVPLAAAGAPAVVLADDGLKSRLVKLENEAAIREVHQSWLRQVNSGDGAAVAGDAVMPRIADADAAGRIARSIAADHTAEPDTIEVAPDGNSATGRFHCVVEIETPLANDSTLAQMAHAQGSGFVRRSERRILHFRYAKANGAWSLAKAEFATA